MKKVSVDNEVPCPRCGKANHCGIDTAEGCWCWHELSGRLRPDPATEQCYCRNCLEALLAEQDDPAT